MNARIDEKGKFYTQRVSKDAVTAMVRTLDYLVVGDIHVRPDRRFKDELDSDKSRFLPVTEATVYEPSGTRMLYKTDFLLLAYQQIVMIGPVEAFTDSGDGPWQHLLQEAAE